MPTENDAGPPGTPGASSALVLAFSAAFATLIVAPSLLPGPLPVYPRMTLGDALDLLAPLVLIPLSWVLFARETRGARSAPATTLFIAFAALWVEGHGIHLAANSIGHWWKASDSEEARALSRFYDEGLGHWLWHAGIVGLAAMLLRAAARGDAKGREGATGPDREGPGGPAPPARRGRHAAAVSVSSALYGFAFFAAVTEGGTARLGVPFALVVVAAGATRWRARLARRPLLATLVAAHLVAAALFAAWALLWHGLPEFSEVGIIR